MLRTFACAAKNDDDKQVCTYGGGAGVNGVVVVNPVWVLCSLVATENRANEQVEQGEPVDVFFL